jgi:hypothetical protein
LATAGPSDGLKPWAAERMPLKNSLTRSAVTCGGAVGGVSTWGKWRRARGGGEGGGNESRAKAVSGWKSAALVVRGVFTGGTLPVQQPSSAPSTNPLLFLSDVCVCTASKYCFEVFGSAPARRRGCQRRAPSACARRRGAR